MINTFLRAKHWQLFLLMIVIPFGFQVFLFTTIFSNINIDSEPDSTVFFNYFKYFPLMMILFSLIFFGWFWSIAIGLQSKIPKEVKMKVNRFKIFFFIPLIYILFISVFMGSIFGESIETMQQTEVTSILPVFAVIFPLHFFSMFCMFYMLYFVSKTIKTVELQRELRFSDFAGEFFLLWFYIIGIWIIQPKINKMVTIKNIDDKNIA